MSIRAASAVVALLLGAIAAAGMPEEFRIRREQVFEFAEEPALAREGDRVTVRFAAKSLCDVSVAIEDADGRIVRHLASGVLGPTAPPPFQKNSLKQAVVWDGKDDRGRYVDNGDALTVRVSLGLKPRLERVLFWSPKKRVSRASRPLVATSPEGVFVFEGEGADHLRMFDHEGNYVRTVYPFPAGKLAEAKGLEWAVFPQDGARLPLKHGLVQATLLTSGKNVHHGTLAKYQPGATAMAVQGGRIALASERLNRLSTDGTTAGPGLEGPATAIATEVGGQTLQVTPRSAALSPDGRWLYLTGYHFKPRHPRPHHWLPCVARLDTTGDGALDIFAGSAKVGDIGSDDRHFSAPTCVACDARGRVYVADYLNDRIQVFTPDGTHFKSVPIKRPTELAVHHRTGELTVASWMLLNRKSKPNDVKQPLLTRLGPVESPKVIATYPLPLTDHNPVVFMNRNAGLPYTFALDSWAEPATIWLVPAKLGTVEKLIMVRGKMDQAGTEACIRLLVEKDGKLATRRDFGKEAAAAVRRALPPIHARQKLYVDPTSGKLYVFEGQAGVAKSCRSLLEIDPATGEIREVPLPFDAEDLAFDSSGLVYLRTDNVVGRFARSTWREVPFDYGERRESVGFSSSSDGRRCALVSALILPAQRPGCFHQGGMGVSARGHLVVSCYNIATPIREDEMREIREAARTAAGKPYRPKLYPGRQRWGELHIWDERGQPLHVDAFKGLPMVDGVAIDGHDSIYVLATPNRVFGGKPYFLERGETLIKARPGKARLVFAGAKGTPLPLGRGAEPERPPELKRGGGFWVEGADWMYGGVGFGGFNSARGGGGCACWHARFALDYFGRSFTPEVDHFSIAVLDTAGNLILRIGQYGNADDGRPLLPQARGRGLRPPLPRSIGGDEVALFDAAYVAVHSDRRLFVADGGNARILSVRLGYHTTKAIRLADAPRKAQD